MSKRRFSVMVGGVCLALSVSGHATAFGGWGDVFPPLTPEDVSALGAAAQQVNAEEADGRDATVSWQNDRTGTHGTVEGLGKSERAGRACRNYRLFIKVRGYEPYHAEPVMCKADDGKWKFAAGIE